VKTRVFWAQESETAHPYVSMIASTTLSDATDLKKLNIAMRKSLSNYRDSELDDIA